VTSTVNVKFNTDRDLDEESASVSHDNDSIPANARTSVDDMQSPDDSDDDEADVHEDGNEQDDVEDDGHGMGMSKMTLSMMRTRIVGWLGRQSGLSVDLLYPCMFSDSVWTALLTLQHIRALQCLRKVQHLHTVQCPCTVQHLHTVQRPRTVQHLHMVQHLHTVQCLHMVAHNLSTSALLDRNWTSCSKQGLWRRFPNSAQSQQLPSGTSVVLDQTHFFLAT